MTINTTIHKLITQKTNSVINTILEHFKFGKILDIGCGYGSNALFLAQKGFDVTMIDENLVPIQILMESTKHFENKPKLICDNIMNYNFISKFDVILATNILQFLNEKDANNIILKMKENTNINGLNIITTFTEDNPSQNFPYLFKKFELSKLYKDWKILLYDEYITPLEQHDKYKPHKHAIAAIIAQK